MTQSSKTNVSRGMHKGMRKILIAMGRKCGADFMKVILLHMGFWSHEKVTREERKIRDIRRGRVCMIAAAIELQGGDSIHSTRKKGGPSLACLEAVNKHGFVRAKTYCATNPLELVGTVVTWVRGVSDPSD